MPTPLLLLVLLSSTGGPGAHEPGALEPRIPVPPQALAARPLPQPWPSEYRLVVKFADGLRVRADAAGAVRSLSGADLAAVRVVAEEERALFRPALATPASALDDLLRRAAERSGRAQPDLAGIHHVELAGEPDPATLVRVGERLQDLAAVEYATLETLGVPPPGDIAPTTPDLSGSQGYLGPDPGFDARTAWTYGATGGGVRLSDCEYGWVGTHEDLVDVDLHPEPGQTVHPTVAANGWDDHGAAAVGEAAAPHNGYGCDGAVEDAEVHTYTEWSVEEGLRRLTAVTNAIADSAAGDVVMLEMQASGASGFGPAELDPSLWLVTRAGVDAGVVVVGAAGNGNQDLDSAAYASYAALGDSGAILVGAGTSDTSHDKLFFSTYGSRVDVQGWGAAAFSLGYGDAGLYGGDPNQAYTWFSGTSSATPMVAACAVALQDLALSNLGAPLAPEDLRALLVSTGIPQGSGGAIGPMVDLAAAIETLDLPWTPLAEGALAGGGGVAPRLEGQGSMVAGTAVTILVEDAAPVAPALLLVGLTRVDLPVAGGLLVPAPDVLVALATDADGRASVTATAPGLPPGTPLWLQAWVGDAGGPAGVSATHALEAEVR